MTTILDSGTRHHFSSGAQRDLQEGKGHPALIPWEVIERVSKHYEGGAKKYDPWNWLKGMPLSVYLNSMLRHGYKMASAMHDEDHAAAVIFNAACFMVTEEAIKAGHYPPEFDDLRPTWGSAFFNPAPKENDHD